MRKYIFAVMLMMTGITAAQAQRMIPGQKGLGINAGMLSEEADKNYYLDLALTVYGSNGNYRLYCLGYSHRVASYRDIQVPIETFTAEAGYSFQLWSDAGKTFTLNAGITAVAGYESINRGKAMLYDGAAIQDKDNFIYGAGGRFSFETYLSDRLVLLLQGRTKAVWGTDLKQFRPSAGAGLRFNF